MYNNLRTFKHDFSNLKIGLNTLLKSGKTTEALNYLNKADTQFQTDYEFINTGNAIVDAIFSDKQNEIINNNIKISFNGIIPYDAIELPDLCIALGNSLDNAVEACIKLPTTQNKTIEIEAIQNKYLLLIKITNPIHEKAKIIDNTIITTKNDTFSHGIGLYSISKTVKKYDGFYEIQSNESQFTLKMGFMIKPKES